MESKSYRTYDIHDLRIVDKWLSQDTERVLTKRIFCDLMENGVEGIDKSVVIDGYHLCRKGIEMVKNSRNECKQKGIKYMGELESFYNPITIYEKSWRIFNSRISQRLHLLSQFIERSTEKGTLIPSKGNSYTYRYKVKGFSMGSVIPALTIMTVPELKDKEYESPLSGRRKTEESQIGRQSYIEKIAYKLNKVLVNADIDDIAMLKKEFSHKMEILSDLAKKEIDNDLYELYQLIEKHSENWKNECVVLIKQLVKKSSMLSNMLDHADMFLFCGSFLVYHDIYYGAQDLFNEALDIYSKNLSFNCSNDEFLRYVSIYYKLASLYADFYKWDECIKYTDEGIRLIENRKNGDSETQLLWLALRNIKTIALLHSENINDAIKLSEESMAAVKQLDISRRDIWSAKRVMYSYWLLAECYLDKAQMSGEEVVWRMAWDICDEAVSFKPGEKEEENDIDFQERQLRLVIMQMRAYIDIPRNIYLTKSDWDRINALKIERRAFELIEIVKQWECFYLDGSPNLTKANYLIAINDCMINSMGSFKAYLSDDIINSYIKSEEYIIEIFGFYAQECLPVYGRSYGKYLLSSVKTMAELFFSHPFLSQFKDNLGLFYAYVISCMYRLVDAQCIANMLEDEDFYEYIKSGATDAYWELISICCEFSLYIFFDVEHCDKWFEVCFYVDTLIWRRMDGSMSDEGVQRLVHEADIATRRMRQIAESKDIVYNYSLYARIRTVDSYRELFGLSQLP